MNRRRRLLDAAALVLSLGLVIWAGREVLAAQPLCASAGYSDDPSTPGVVDPILTCSGNCNDTDPQTNCAAALGHNPVLGNYYFCACPGEGEPTCCHLIFRQPPAVPQWMGKGNCQAQEAVCPPGNKCSSRGTGAIADPFVSECITAPGGGGGD